MIDRDRDLIHALLMNYSWAIDSKAWDLLASCFTEDCEVTYGNGNSPHPGGSALSFTNRNDLVRYISHTHQPLDGSLHMMSVNSIELISADTAQARTYGRILLVLKSHPDGPSYESAGYYSDFLVREGEQWYLKTRHYTRVWAQGNGKVIQPDSYP